MLRADQAEAVQRFATRREMLLIGPMGSGKTYTTLSALYALRFVGDYARTLVVGPAIVARDVWPQECAKWADELGLTCVHLSGTSGERAAKLTRAADIFSVSYELLPWLAEHVEKTRRLFFGRIIFDESQKLRGFRLDSAILSNKRSANSGAKRAKSAYYLRSLAKSCWLLTGTPSANKLQALWPQMYFIDKGETLGATYGAFIFTFFKRDYVGNISPTVEGKNAIKSALANCPNVIALESPAMQDAEVNYVPLEAPDTVLRVYRKLKSEKAAEVASNKNLIASNSMVLQQVLSQVLAGGGYAATGVEGAKKEAHILSTYRLDWVIDCVEDSQEPCIIVYLWRWQLTYLRLMLKKRGLKAKEFRDKNAPTEWNNEQLDALMLHPQSAGHGVNLQHGGRRYVYCQPMWDNELWSQTNERAGPRRQEAAGFNRQVYITVPYSRGTVEDKSLRTRENRELDQADLIKAILND